MNPPKKRATAQMNTRNFIKNQIFKCNICGDAVSANASSVCPDCDCVMCEWCTEEAQSSNICKCPE